MNHKSIAQILEILYRKAYKSKLKDQKLTELSEELKMVNAYFNTTDWQSMLLAVIFVKSTINSLNVNDLMDYFGLNDVKFLRLIPEIKNLQKKNFFSDTDSDLKNLTFDLNGTIQECIFDNQPIPIEFLNSQDLKKNLESLMKEFKKLKNEKTNRNESGFIFQNKFRRLMDKFHELKLLQYLKPKLRMDETFLLLEMLEDFWMYGHEDFYTDLTYSLNIYYDSHQESMKKTIQIIHGESALVKLALLDVEPNQIAKETHVKLSYKFLEVMNQLEHLDLQISPIKDKRLKYPEQIDPKALYYNASEQEMLLPLQKSLADTTFKKLQKKLQQAHLPMGLTVLLYGQPGTGKTETVYQLARKYRRPVWKVDISETKSMWLGESEKRIKKIFTDYAAIKERQKICPILLFNEADGIIGKRNENIRGSVDQTQNTLQNILLDELERFDGIFFATTNLVGNLDTAFERRFLFKVHFDKPTLENAARIWKNKIPYLSQHQALQLANEFTFSGGEMDNIARKVLMNELLQNTKPNFENIKAFCQQERWAEKDTRVKVGFKV